jgi:hypothetical protein
MGLGKPFCGAAKSHGDPWAFPETVAQNDNHILILIIADEKDNLRVEGLIIKNGLHLANPFN